MNDDYLKNTVWKDTKRSNKTTNILLKNIKI